MELRFQRELDRLQAAQAYRNARQGPWAEALSWINRTEEILQRSRAAHQVLSHRFEELWARENKPYAMDRAMNRYRDLLAKYDAQIERLRRVRTNAKTDRSLPRSRDVGLELIEEDKQNGAATAAK
jgi:hypothetical protein